MTDTLIGKMGYTPIFSIKNIKGAAHKNGDVDDTCKRSLIPLNQSNYTESRFLLLRAYSHKVKAKKIKEK